MMNFMNRSFVMVMGSPRSANSSRLGWMMVCSIITPSAGSAS